MTHLKADFKEITKPIHSDYLTNEKELGKLDQSRSHVNQIWLFIVVLRMMSIKC